MQTECYYDGHMISIKEIEKLAELSRLELSEGEKESLRKEMDSILGYVEQVNRVSAEASSENKADSLRTVWREDGTPHESGLYTEALLASAPQREGQYIRVKKIL